MKRFDIDQTDAFDALLALRERELCAVLDAHEKLRSAPGGDPDGVTDFKDLAGEQSLADVDEAQGERAALELEQVLAARRRLHDHTFGRCVRCGQAIDLRRLTAVPATARCTACQTLQEAAAPPPVTH
ncbi:MAG: transcriptional regulator, TraR/DksA family [Ramlibacter sp.]|jgi:DnaK suppressor protein|nr:transcriptional regulator, TraR/DksA family [Ramlibacter sp.]